MKKLKLSAEHIRRLRVREEFSAEYKLLNTLIRANAATVYAMFKYAFYDVKDGRELLLKRGISGKHSKYLDYIDEKEMKYLVRGLKKINAICAQPNRDFKGFPGAYMEAAKLGRKLRYQFYKTYKTYPEDNPICGLATKYIKSASKKQEIMFNNEPKTIETLQNEYNILLAERNRLEQDLQTYRNILETAVVKEERREGIDH